MERERIIETIEKWNPWKNEIDSGIRRNEYLEKISKWLENEEIIVLKGIRRTGKSTIVKQIINELIKSGKKKEQILYLNLEDYAFINHLNLSLLDQILETYKEVINKNDKTYMFIDEVQALEGWERWIRTKYDLKENIKFIVTGSCGSLLSKELSTLLTGRNITFTIRPLSYKEVKTFNNNLNLKDYLEFGGFPAVVLEKDKQKKRILLQQYLDDILFKDIIKRYRIRNKEQVIRVAKTIISNIGSKVSYNKLSSSLKLSKTTIAKYVEYMIDAFLLYEVKFFSFSARLRYDKNKISKIYSLDNGFTTIVSEGYSKDFGKIYENTVLIKLFEKSQDLFKNIYYWSDNQSEVDFIIEKTAINVTSTNQIPKREFEGIERFIKRKKGFNWIIVTESLKKVNIMGIEEFLFT